MALAQTTVRLYVQNEPRYYTVDNRPLTDLDNNVKNLAGEITSIEATGILGVKFFTGAGTPIGNVTAPIGSFYLNSTGGANTTLWVKESGVGNTGWVAK